MSERLTSDSGLRPVCTFRLGSRLHGIEVAHVREVSPCLPITPVPQAPPAVRGLVNLRSRIHLALDPRPLLGLGRIEIGPDCRLVILKPGVAPDLGLLVDRGGDIVHVESSQIESLAGSDAQAPGAPSASGLIAGACKLPGELLLILDPTKLIDAVLGQFRSGGPAANGAALENNP